MVAVSFAARIFRAGRCATHGLALTTMHAFQTYVDAVAKYYVYGSAAMILVLTVAWPYIGGVEVILYDIPQGAEPGITHVGITAALASFRGDHAGDHTIKTESCSGLLAEDIGELTCRTVKTTSALLAIFCLIVVARVWHHTWASLITVGAGLVAGILTGFFAGAEDGGLPRALPVVAPRTSSRRPG